MTTLTIVAGAPGTGKSTFGKSLARKQKCVYLDIDEHTGHLVQAGLQLAGIPFDDRDSKMFKDHFRTPIHDVLYALVSDQIERFDTVLCAPFTQEIQKPGWHKELAERFSCDVKIYWLTCRETTLKARIAERGERRDSGKLTAWGAFYQYAGRVGPACECTIIDTTNTFPQA